MRHSVIPIALSVAALFAVSACQTTGETTSKDDITWNAPATPETKPAPPASAPPPEAAAKPEQECREYQQTVTIDGKPQKAYGRACRQADGTWKTVGEMKKIPPPPNPSKQVHNSYPYGWYGYDYPYGPRYRPGYSIGVGAGSRGGYFGYGVGF